MKLLDIMKKYDRCLVRESAKLTKIYNMLLKESADEADDADLSEEACEICGNDPCTCDANEAEETDGLDECGLIPEDDFIKKDGVEENDMLRNRPHNGHIDDPAGIMSEKDFFACEAEEENEETNEDDGSEDDDTVSAEEFFSEAEKCDGEGCDEAEEMMSAAEFFGSADKPKTANEAEDDSTDTDESEKTNEPENTDESEEIDEETEIEPNERMISARELLPETEEKKLEESLKSYRRKNHRLFNG